MYPQDQRFAELAKGVAMHGFIPKVGMGEIQSISKSIGLPILFAQQEHSNEVLVMEEAWDINAPPEGDSIVSKLPGIALSVWTADCVPVLMLDCIGRVIAAVHCGWQGSVNGIIRKTVDEMQKQGSLPENIMCAIGPCIRQASYSVGKDIYDLVTEVESAEQKRKILKPIGEEKFLYDIPLYIKHQLFNLGIKNVCDCNINTYTDRSFSSYRLAQKRDEPLSKNNLSFIALKPLEEWSQIEDQIARPFRFQKRISPSGGGQMAMSKKIETIVTVTGRKADNKIDLHGLSIDKAYETLEGFIKDQAGHGNRFLLVITGKALRGDPSQPSINKEIVKWLEHSQMSEYVSHFTHASLKDGGKGAFYVFLRKQRTL